MPPYTDATMTRLTRSNAQGGPTAGPGPATVAGRVTTRSGLGGTVTNTKPGTDSASPKIYGSKPPSLKRTSSEALTSSEGESDGGDEEDGRLDIDGDAQDTPNSRGENEKKDRAIKKKRKRRRRVKPALTAPIVVLVEDAPTIKSQDKGKRRASVPNPSPLSVSASASTSILESTNSRRTRSSQNLSIPSSGTATGPTGSLTAGTPATNAQTMNVGHSTLPGSDHPNSPSGSPSKVKDKGKGKSRATTPPASSSTFPTTAGSPMAIVEASGSNAIPDSSAGPSNRTIVSDSSATDALKAEIARLKREVDEHKRLPATLTQHVTCLICLELLWRPFGVVPCGHVVCYGCMIRWFCAPPPGGAAVDAGRANVNPALDAGAGGGAANNDPAPANAEDNANGASAEDRELQRILDSPLARRGTYIRRAKTCPVCRCVVRERPVELWAMKAVVAAVGRASGVDDPSGGANLNANVNANIDQGGAAVPRENDPWRNIFGPPARRQHGRQPFLEPWAGAYDEDDEDEEDFEPHDIHNFHHAPFYRQRMLDDDDLSDEEDFEDDGLDEQDVQDAIDHAIAHWEGQGRGPRPRNVVPIADRMRMARGRGPGRRRGAVAGAAVPGVPAAAQGNPDNGAFGWHDAEDGGIYRCWDCMHEIWDGDCAGCGRRYDLPPNHRHDLGLDGDAERDIFDDGALEEQIAWLEAEGHEDEDDEELHGGGYGGGVYRRRLYDYEVDVDEDEEEAEPGEFDGWLDDDDGEGGLRGEHEVFHDALEGDDDDGAEGDIYADEWHGLHHGHPHYYPRNHVLPDEDDDEVEVVEDGPAQELLSDDELEDLVQLAQRQPNARNADRRVQLAALRRRGLLAPDHEDDAEDDGEESDIIEVVEHLPRIRHARRRWVESSDEEEDEPPLITRAVNGGPVQGRYHESTDEEAEPLRNAARQRLPPRNAGADANVGAANGYPRRSGRAVVLSDDDDEEVYAVPRRRI